MSVRGNIEHTQKRNKTIALRLVIHFVRAHICIRLKTFKKDFVNLFQYVMPVCIFMHLFTEKVCFLFPFALTQHSSDFKTKLIVRRNF